ncbi:telomere repeat-binding factor 1-like [Thalictrum thalictroides]|uniref:Telomere repeat-binding factor 1-like n=1 Tax=Thalictrum thalictroides TaxID=46969 RepID=A0A7J6VR89_THATH|nr:telomere repeat-binding factor 1-like [Thalictrum thalictroides]
MGAPKQKWTSEEEAALHAGIVKHGAGKWRMILKDPEFSSILSLRSNVDLKDKFRNLNVIANGWPSRQSRKKSHEIIKHDEIPLDTTVVVQRDEDIVDVEPLDTAPGFLQISDDSNDSISRLDILVLEAITSLKEPRGSNKTNIAIYIEDQYDAPPNFNQILASKLTDLTTSGKLIKVNGKYRIAPNAAFSEVGNNSGRPLLEGTQMDSYNAEKVGKRILTASQVDAELAKMRNMTAQEAAAAAARAVAEAEIAMAEAEEAAKEAEAAEADAEAAQAFAEVAMATLKNIITPNLVRISSFSRRKFLSSPT